MTALMWSAYAIPLSLAVFLHIRRRWRVEGHAATKLRHAVATGMTEPPSLHPVVDSAVCCGSRACVNACPEQALGIVGGKAQLVNAAACIGHGACAAACPVEAIKLVFGTARRGMDIPYVKPTFETNVPGIYIAGELGGMGLVRKAAEQGRQAVESISRERARNGDDMLDLIIVGAGPAGLSATLSAMEKKLRFVTLEQEDSLGGTVYHYPRNKVVMTQPVVLPMVGKTMLGEISKESLLAFWLDIVARFGIEITFGARVDKVAPILSRRAGANIAPAACSWPSAAAAHRARSAPRARTCRRLCTGSSTLNSTAASGCWWSVAGTAPSRPPSRSRASPARASRCLIAATRSAGSSRRIEKA
jgi:thioredoxin reductase (NADPH)